MSLLLFTSDDHVDHQTGGEKVMGIKTVINPDSTKTQIWIDTPANVLWRERWQHAWDAMPRHSGTILCLLLGYKTRSPTGHYLGNNTVFNNWRRGSKPRNPQAARLLTMLGGPHSETMAKAIAIQRGISFK